MGLHSKRSHRVHGWGDSSQFWGAGVVKEAQLAELAVFCRPPKAAKAGQAPSALAVCCKLTGDRVFYPVCVLIEAVRHRLVQVLAQVVSC